MKDIQNRYEQLVSLKGTHNWSDVRNVDKFDLRPIQYVFGTRNTFVPKVQGSNVDLQDSRGNAIVLDQSFDDYIDKIRKAAEEIEESDYVRLSELNVVFDALSKEGVNVSKETLCEVGFRNPRLLNFYKRTFNRVVGYDISEINVRVGNLLGYDCALWDLNDPKSTPPDQFDVVLCYHVLEHTYDPVTSLKSIKNIMKPGGILHVEIPIEPGTPRLNFGHLIALESGDLKNMLEICGFEPQSLSNVTHTGGPVIERITAINPGF